MSLMLLIPLVLPIVAAGLVLATGRYPNLRDSISVVAGLIVAATVVMIQQDFQPYSFTLAEPLPGISLAFRLDELGLIFMLVAGLLWPVTTLYAIGYMRGHGEDNQTSFFAWFAVAISCTMAIALSANLFTLFLFYEALTLATWPLVVHARTDEARAGGRTYLSVLLFTSIAFLLFAIIGTWFVAGT
ncbi:MAG: multicomponent Na+:H+ antiporter subunit D, partial [Candidatus Azotimanducaceae bacterium]